MRNRKSPELASIQQAILDRKPTFGPPGSQGLGGRLASQTFTVQTVVLEAIRKGITMPEQSVKLKRK